MERAYQGPDNRAVREMFAGIAHRYDFLNHFLSASIDRVWRKAAVRRVRELTALSSGSLCLDLCSGTGDLALELQRGLKTGVIASDFCHPMLTRCHQKVRSAGLENAIRMTEADALSLPFRDASFDAVTVAFGLRNLEDPKAGIAEMRRVLKPGGALVVLEFSKPKTPVIKHIFNFYFRHILPHLGALISGDGNAYKYLPDSVRKFPSQEELVEMMRSLGLSEVKHQNLSGGIAALHWGKAA